MPSFSKTKYSPERTQEISVAAMLVLDEAEEALTGEQIRQSDLTLTNVTTQKLARVLGELAEKGFIKKTKGRDGKMRYKSIEVLMRQGYDINAMVYQ